VVIPKYPERFNGEEERGKNRRGIYRGCGRDFVNLTKPHRFELQAGGPTTGRKRRSHTKEIATEGALGEITPRAECY